MRKGDLVLILTAVLMACGVGAQANVLMETVHVGNAGNLPDTRYVSSGVGGVAYEYDIGKYEVTAGQYTEFLNAVADTDPYGLYDERMWTMGGKGCQIQRTGQPGSYSYSITSVKSNRPVNYVSWGDVVRFANWMHNGQGDGDTETGSYSVNGAMTLDDFASVTREPGATWVIPSADEWHKAAYHKNNGITDDYFDYATSNDRRPSLELNGGGNNATMCDYTNYLYTIGAPHYRTESGAHVNTTSPYGTYSQAGNVMEWTDTKKQSAGTKRYLRGGSWAEDVFWGKADFLWSVTTDAEWNDAGFRLALVPEPASLTLLALGGLAVLRRR